MGFKGGEETKRQLFLEGRIGEPELLKLLLLLESLARHLRLSLLRDGTGALAFLRSGRIGQDLERSLVFRGVLRCTALHESPPVYVWLRRVTRHLRQARDNLPERAPSIAARWIAHQIDPPERVDRSKSLGEGGRAPRGGVSATAAAFGAATRGGDSDRN